MNTATQLNLFDTHRLPRKPFCSDAPDGSGGIIMIRNQVHALKRKFVQLNSPVLHHWLIYDVARDDAARAWENVTAQPNFSVASPEGDRAHLIYGIEVPVVTSDAGRLRPLKYAAAIDQSYTDNLGADRAYPGLLARNPRHKHWTVSHGPSEAYELADLAAFIAPKKLGAAKRRRKHPAGLKRNDAVFEDLARWAYREVHQLWISEAAWCGAVFNRAGLLNTFEAPLPIGEIRAISLSVARYCWRNLRGWTQAEYIARTHTSEAQAIRGKKGGVNSGEARRKGTPLEHDREPWVALGISRRTYFYRRKKGQL